MSEIRQAMSINNSYSDVPVVSGLEKKCFTDKRRRLSRIREMIWGSEIVHESSLAILLLFCGLFLVTSPPVLTGPVGLMARDSIPQTFQGLFLLALGSCRMYGVAYQNSRVRLITAATSAVVWLSFFLMSIGSVPPGIGSPMYLWLALNSLFIMFKIKK